ncbi:NAD(P)H-dependent oxidoreductase [Marinicella sp. W31]|uniref:NAD(P)H-dependent oxidoreductase n=1 Tax=Marinicella sp. W31 TaxID=3023713 RepID=UPI00375766A8
MPKILIQLAHPVLQYSLLNQRMKKAVESMPSVTYNDLYEQYPDFMIDVEHEQELLRQHDVIVLQHPFYWYSVPALMKEWMDLVLEHGFAYGKDGTALQGKVLLSAITTGGDESTYQHSTSIRDFLKPIEATAGLCGMQYLAPFVIHSSHKIKAGNFSEDLPEDVVERESANYKLMVENLASGEFDVEKAKQVQRINHPAAKLLGVGT